MIIQWHKSKVNILKKHFYQNFRQSTLANL